MHTKSGFPENMPSCKKKVKHLRLHPLGKLQKKFKIIAPLPAMPIQPQVASSVARYTCILKHTDPFDMVLPLLLLPTDKWLGKECLCVCVHVRAGRRGEGFSSMPSPPCQQQNYQSSYLLLQHASHSALRARGHAARLYNVLQRFRRPYCSCWNRH